MKTNIKKIAFSLLLCTIIAVPSVKAFASCYSEWLTSYNTITATYHHTLDTVCPTYLLEVGPSAYVAC